MIKVQELIDYDTRNPLGKGTDLQEKWMLYSILRMIQPDDALEVGVSRGHMTCWLAMAMQHNQKGHITSVDNWSRAHGGEAISDSYATKRLIDCGLREFVTFKASGSFEFLDDQESESIDFVWIDGDHSYEGALRDVTEAIRVSGKFVAVHDTNQQYAGPRQAIEEIENTTEFKGTWIKGGRGIWMLNK